MLLLSMYPRHKSERVFINADFIEKGRINLEEIEYSAGISGINRSYYRPLFTVNGEDYIATKDFENNLITFDSNKGKNAEDFVKAIMTKDIDYLKKLKVIFIEK